MNRLSLLLALSLLLNSIKVDAQAGYDTVHVYFEISKTTLSPAEKNNLQQNAARLKQQANLKILVYGYADYLGTEKNNYKLAEERAQQIAAQLKAMGVPNESILLIGGVGGLPYSGQPSPLGRPQDRRVDIFIRRQQQTEKVVTKEATPIARQIEQLKVNEAIALPDILFYGGRHVLLPQSYNSLAALLNELKKFPKKRFAIEGHICCQIGIEGDGMDFDTGLPNLSLARAKVVYEYLINNGIAESQLTYRGFGSSRPKHNPERTELHQQENRRVEIRVIE